MTDNLRMSVVATPVELSPDDKRLYKAACNGISATSISEMELLKTRIGRDYMLKKMLAARTVSAVDAPRPFGERPSRCPEYTRDEIHERYVAVIAAEKRLKRLYCACCPGVCKGTSADVSWFITWLTGGK